MQNVKRTSQVLVSKLSDSCLYGKKIIYIHYQNSKQTKVHNFGFPKFYWAIFVGLYFHMLVKLKATTNFI